jgi:hypothetical protein
MLALRQINLGRLAADSQTWMLHISGRRAFRLDFSGALTFLGASWVSVA